MTDLAASDLASIYPQPTARVIAKARPEIDVLQFVVRWGGRENELTPISLTAATFQFLLMVVTIPAVKVLPPSVLYQPEIGPSAQAFLLILALSFALLALTYAVWWGRIEADAPREQQREAYQHG